MKRYLLWVSVVLLSAMPLRATLAQSTIHVPGESGLQQAIANVANGGVIEMAGGTYEAPSSGFSISAAQKHFTIRAAASQSVTITRSSSGSQGLFLISSSNPNQGQHVTFERISFEGGISDEDERAGAITISRSDVTFIDCNFQSNNANSSNPAGGNGGALILRSATVLVVGSSFTGNQAWRSGGAIDLRGGSHLAIHDSQFIGNRVNEAEHFANSLGGAIFALNSSLRVTNTRFESNEAGFAGGAIYSFGDWTTTAPDFPTNVLITNSTFDSNSVQCNSTSCPANFTVVAGALVAENDVTTRIDNTRFEDNTAAQGGAIQVYRSQMAIHNSTFLGNRATGTSSGMGYGGAIVAVSADQNTADSVNRPSAQLTITSSLFQGHHGATSSTGRFGGCIFAQGDYNRQYGRGGMPKNGSLQFNRANINISNSIFSDCDVEGDSSSSSVGGALFVQLAKLTLNDSLLLHCDALGSDTSKGSGGALAIEDQALANISGITIAKSTAAFNGGAIWATGSELNLSSSQIIENRLTTSQFDGAAIYTAAENIYQLNKATGLVKDNLFSNNSGPGGKHTLYDYDPGTTSNLNNLVQYSNNQIFPDNATVYSDHVWGSGDVAFLNSIAAKAPSSNIGLGTEPVVGATESAPSSILSTNAPGDPAGDTTAYVGVAWSGAAATIDGNNANGNAVLVPASAGSHTLAVGGSQTWTATITQAPFPTSTLTLQPPVVSGGSTALVWQTPAGTFLDQLIDQGVAVPQPASANGSVSVTPAASTTYHGLMVAVEGGVYTKAHLTIANDLIFFDGFDQ